MKISRLLPAALIVLSLAAPEALAAAKARPAPLSENDRAEIGRAETYLNDVRTLKARFLQSSPDGQVAEGTFYLSRPGKLRLEYDPPVPILIIGAGLLLTYHDRELKQTSHLPIDSTPAGILVRPKIALMGPDLTVTGFRNAEGLDRISLARTDDPQAGEITLIFTREPYQLRQWTVRDPQGQITTVTLSDARLGLKFDAKLFEFEDPNFFRPGAGSINRE
ncbi:MAG: outer membrane lipoprotein carrier protein LolA [Alphaproteobacteria bacterium]|nr:outer membrane lipoprotein carrier protein LolA [Alphaproteobacteria bacterium]